MARRTWRRILPDREFDETVIPRLMWLARRARPSRDPFGDPSGVRFQSRVKQQREMFARAAKRSVSQSTSRAVDSPPRADADLLEAA